MPDAFDDGTSNRYYHDMRMMSGKVVQGSVVVDELVPPLVEGSVVTVLAPDAEVVSLTEIDRAELRASVAEIDRGEFISADELFDLLARQKYRR